jgi:hypothetical protein
MRLVTDSARSTPPGGADRAVLAAERRRQAGCCGIRSSTRGRSSWCTRPYLGDRVHRHGTVRPAKSWCSAGGLSDPRDFSVTAEAQQCALGVCDQRPELLVAVTP